jgi:DNA-binding GntR family transcriptional regulator
LRAERGTDYTGFDVNLQAANYKAARIVTKAPYLQLPARPVHPGSAAARLATVTEVVLADLRQAILTGALAAGTLLRQEDVAGRFGVSRPPVREALRQLEAEGLAEYRPRRGYAVASLDPSDIEEIFEIRMLLEERAAFLAAQRRTERDIAELKALLLEMEDIAIGQGYDLERFMAANRAFHERILQTSGRKRLCRLMLGLRDNVERYVRAGAAMIGSMERVRREHRQIFEAFRKGDAERTAALCAAHVRATGERLLRALRNSGAGSACAAETAPERARRRSARAA